MKRLISVITAVLVIAFALVVCGEDSRLPDGDYDSGAGVTGEGPFPYGSFAVKGNNISYMGPNPSSGRGAVITEGKYEIDGKEMRFINSDGKVRNAWTFEKKSEDIYIIDGTRFTRKK